MTGEETLSDTNTNTGVNTRVLEIEGSPFNYDEKSASELYKIVSKYYGTAGRKFINILIEKYSENKYLALKERFETVYKELEKNTKNNIRSYISAVSIVVLADMILNEEIINTEMEESSIDMGIEILDNLSKQEDIDIVNKCYEDISSWLISKHTNFDIYPIDDFGKTIGDRYPDKDLDITTENKTSYGLYNENIYYVHLCIMRSKLKREGYNYYKMVKEFAKRGYTLSKKDENGKIIEATVQKKIRNVNTRFIAFPINAINEPRFDTSERPTYFEDMTIL